MREIAIERHDMYTRDRFLSQTFGKHPIIFQNGIKDWPAITQWNFSYLDKKIGHLVVKTRQSKNFLFPCFNDKKQDSNIYREMTVHDYLALLESTNKPPHHFLFGDDLLLYMKGRQQARLSSLAADISIPHFFDQSQIYSGGLWISSEGTQSWLHYDKLGLDNINIQISGSKKVWLISPHMPHCLYLHDSINSASSNFSQVNITSPDLLQFPNFSRLDMYIGELNPGDMLYIPAYWLHSFKHTGQENLNVNYWWEEKYT